MPRSNFYTYAELAKLISEGRSKRDRPIANNTRARIKGDGIIAIKLHATDIIELHEDGRRFLNASGWRTVTTLERLRRFTNVHMESERGEWYVDLAPDESDPEPPRGSRSIPKPFHAHDPGPEPVDDGVGCVAGTSEEFWAPRDEYLRWSDAKPGEWTFLRTKSYGGEDILVRKWSKITHIYGEDAHQYQYAWKHGNFTPNEHYFQCPHCKAFAARHEHWRVRMEGSRWQKIPSYREMCQMLERFGTREEWQDAYLADFRRTREQRAAWKEWRERNRTPFEDGIEIDAEGYALRADPASVLRIIERESARKQVDEFVRKCVARLREGMPMPSGGDCWYCAMTSAPQDHEPHPGAVSMGDAMPTLHEDGSVTHEPSHGHLRDHMEEEYIVPSMFVNAMRERGYKDVGIYMMLDMDPDAGTMGGDRHGLGYSNVARDLRRYLYKRLIPEIQA